jgi:hypothetical protein
VDREARRESVSEYITLLGAEQIQDAANRINEAAETIRQAAGSLDDTFRQHRCFMDDWLDRLRAMFDEREQTITRGEQHGQVGNSHDGLLAACRMALAALRAEYRDATGTEPTDDSTAEIRKLVQEINKAEQGESQ